MSTDLIKARGTSGGILVTTNNIIRAETDAYFRRYAEKIKFCTKQA